MCHSQSDLFYSHTHSIKTIISWVQHNLSDFSCQDGNLAGIIGRHMNSVSHQMTT